MIEKGAIISECKKYRFQLWRIWDRSKPFVLFIMHNPSTADDTEDDPTIRRCINFAKDWGYGGIYVGNYFPYRSTDPEKLKGKPIDEIMPPANSWNIHAMAIKCTMHVVAHGNLIIKNPPKLFRGNHWHYLQLTKTGNPCHPLYLKKTLVPIPINSLTPASNEKPD